MSRSTPTVSAGSLYDPAAPAPGIRLDGPAWPTWLEAPTTTRFAYPLFDPAVGYIVGFMTVRKERRRRGGAYWTAYRRAGGRLRKVYLGRAAAVTPARLEAIAQALLAEAATRKEARAMDGR
jgi:LuxR family maltose regulon positive regulatory protein